MRAMRIIFPAAVSVSAAVIPLAHGAIVASPSVSPNPLAPGQPATFTHSASSETDPLRTLTLFEWDFDYDGTFLADDSTTGSPSVTHSYSLFGVYTAALRVTNDLLQTAIATESVSVSLGNQAPVATAGGPYQVTFGSPLQLNGSSSSDPNAASGDSITEYAWDLDNDAVYDVFGATPSVAFTTLQSKGVATPNVARLLKLRVMDEFGVTSTSTTTFTVVPEPATALVIGAGIPMLLRRVRRPGR